jgi:hypothetical protein
MGTVKTGAILLSSTLANGLASRSSAIGIPGSDSLIIRIICASVQRLLSMRLLLLSWRRLCTNDFRGGSLFADLLRVLFRDFKISKQLAFLRPKPVGRQCSCNTPARIAPLNKR